MAAKLSRGRLLRGIGANLYGQGVVTFVQLAGVPILLHAWGVSLYGEWLVLTAIPVYIGMSNLGFVMSAANDMTRLVAKGDRTGALAVFQSLFAFMVTITGTLFAILSVLFWTLPLNHWFHSSTLGSFDLRWILWCLSADVFIKLFDGLNHAGYRAVGDYALHQAIYYSILIIQQSIVWACALTGHNPAFAASCYVCFSVVAIPSTAVLLRVRHSWMKVGMSMAKFSELRRLSGPAMGNLSGTIAQAFSIQGMTLIVASMLGPVAVVTLSTLRTMTRIALQMVGVISLAAEPEFAAMAGGEDLAPQTALYLQMMSVSFWVASTMVFALVLAGPLLLSVWTHGRVSMNIPLFYWLLATVISQTMWSGAIALLRGRNEHMSATMFQVVMVIGSLCSAAVLLWLSHRLAIVGFSLFVFDVGFLLFVFRKLHQNYGIRARDLAKFAADPRPVIRFLKARIYA
jgi:O-antigen/teichoic acid export membrane protein